MYWFGSKHHLVALTATLLLFLGCSSQRTGPGEGVHPDEAVAARCTAECCCRTRDGYYVRYQCRSRGRCEDAGGKCLSSDLDRCAV